MKKKTIIIIEDDEGVRVPFEHLLREQKFHILSAEDGASAISLVQKSKPDLILLDLLLPVIDGFTVFEEIKRYEHTRDVPVVIISNLSGEDEIRRGLSLGAAKYFVKSQFSIRHVIDYIVSVLS